MGTLWQYYDLLRLHGKPETVTDGGLYAVIEGVGTLEMRYKEGFLYTYNNRLYYLALTNLSDKELNKMQK